ncbi:MAG: rRNA pseudouridine synthase [Chloroflexota bacterium]|nr:rRNA pseudouridine synthase [Chloroflexota bacterium]
MIRLQKVMADRGVASRRAAEEMITEGRVRVNGDLITTLGSRVAEDAHIEVDGRLIAAPAPHRYVLMNKPVGIVSTAQDEHGRRTVVDHIGARERLYPVGRLDTDSEGLLLLTNDGTWAERVLHPRYGHEREYDAWVEGDLTDDALARLQRGIPLEEGTARAVRVSVRSRSRGRSRLSLVLLTGWKRQVRRMLAAVGLKVTRLVRVRMGPLELGKLRPGEFRDLTKREIDAMTKPTAQPKTQGREETARAVAPPRIAPQVTRREPVRAVAQRIARRTPITRTRVGPVESVRAAAPRVTRRAGVSRARVEGPRRQPFGARAVQAGRPTRERNPRAAAGPAAQFVPRRRSTRAAAGRAAPRRASGGRA